MRCKGWMKYSEYRSGELIINNQKTTQIPGTVTEPKRTDFETGSEMELAMVFFTKSLEMIRNKNLYNLEIKNQRLIGTFS